MVGQFAGRPWTGYLASVTVVFIWSMWLVVSRLAAGSPLTVFDLAAFRYGVAGIVALPFVLRYRPWRRLSLFQMAMISFILGPIYIMAVFGGFAYAPAAHGGIFMNGVLPLISISIGLVFLAATPQPRQIIGALIILAAALVLATDAQGLDVSQSWRADLLFVVGALFFAVYIVLSRQWALKTTEILFCGTVINAVIYLPIWALFLPSGIAEASAHDLALQMGYQGLVPNLVGLLLIAYSSRTIGAEATSGVLAAVPALGAVFGVLLLNEPLSGMSWIAIGVLTFGLLLTTLRMKFPRSARVV